jgi:hypothetical protein
MFRKFTAFSPTVKNRYEILFFNKDALCAMMYSIKKYNNSSSGSSSQTSSQNNNSSNGSLNQNSLQNNNSLNNVNNTSLQELKSEFSRLSQDDLANIEKKIIKNININISKCKIDFKENEIINYYNILKDCSYLRLYFKYTDDKTLEERFKKTGKKDFNYVQKYNTSIFKIFSDLIRKTFKKELNYKEIENNYKKLDKSTQKEIDGILNIKVNNEEEHYEKIKEVLKIIKDKTGSINYCIILDIKKSKLMSINSIIKKTNSNNKTFQTGGDNKFLQMIGHFVPLYIIWMYLYYYIYHIGTTKKHPNSIWYCLGKAGMPGDRTKPSQCMHY